MTKIGNRDPGRFITADLYPPMMSSMVAMNAIFDNDEKGVDVVVVVVV